ALVVGVALAILRLLLLPLAADRHHVVVDLDLDVIPGEARQVGTDQELALPAQDVDPRRPVGRDEPGLAPQQLVAAGQRPGQAPAEAEAEAVEDAVDLLGEVAQQVEGGAGAGRARGARRLLHRAAGPRPGGFLDFRHDPRSFPRVWRNDQG